MKNSKIEWCDHTFNAWEGCTKVSPGCANCYAEERNKRYHAGNNWGKGAPRLIRSDAYWKEPLKWNSYASGNPTGCILEISGPDPKHPGVMLGEYRKMRVFCSSLADWLDEEAPIDQLARLLKLIMDTPNLDWLLLTKRPENWLGRIQTARNYLTVSDAAVALWLNDWMPTPATMGAYERGRQATTSNPSTHGLPPANVWIGTTVEDQQRADERIPELFKIPARIRFLSCEPLIGGVFVDRWLWGREKPCEKCSKDVDCECGYQPRHKLPDEPSISWIICGGESGPKARPMHPDWARSLRDQCQTAGVPFHFKQWGEWVTERQSPEDIVLPGQSTAFWAEQATDGEYTEGDQTCVFKVGKKSAGRLLDGRTWDEFPHSVQPKSAP